MTPARRRGQEERLAEMQRRVDEADTLWTRLSTPTEDRQRLLALKTSPGASAAERADAELAALRAQLQARLGDLIAALRKRISGLWEELNMTQEKGEEEFPAFALAAGEFSDTVLTEHEQYVDMLEDRARRLRPILKARGGCGARGIPSACSPCLCPSSPCACRPPPWRRTLHAVRTWLPRGSSTTSSCRTPRGCCPGGRAERAWRAQRKHTQCPLAARLTTQ